MDFKVRLNYCSNAKDKKTNVKVFLDNGVMLDGIISDYDSHNIILNQCLINWDKIVSISPK